MSDRGGSEPRSISQQSGSSDCDPKNDICTPFCICSCCSMSVVKQAIPYVITEQRENAEIATVPVDYESPATSTFQNSIWQPPKI